MANARLTQEEFIRRSRAVHGNRYDYSKSVYEVGNNTVIITCPKHGDFEQIANSHMQGTPCPSCSHRKKITPEDFVRRSRMSHGFKYSYKNPTCTTSTALVTITCPEHGDFIKTASSHMGGAGCPKCKRLPSFMYTEDFLEQARAVHGDKYDYSQTFYVDPYYAMTIICPVHGEFKQRPTGHLRGVGCPDCTPNLNQP